MKNLIIILSIVIISSAVSSTSAQFDLPKKLKKKINKELDKATDDAVDKTVDAVKKGGTGKEESGNADKNNSPQNNTDKTKEEGSTGNADMQKNKEELKVWSNYDFVPGEKIIFEDNLTGEEIGEFPSRWDLLSGSAEVAIQSSSPLRTKRIFFRKFLQSSSMHFLRKTGSPDQIYIK